MAADKKVEFIPIENLEFDPENPRFSRLFVGSSQPVDIVIERMVKNENVQELMGSIAEQDYFIGEPLLVAELDNNNYTVVEGNRRLAALKLLSGLLGDDRLPSITELRTNAKFIPKQAPCIIFKTRREILKYLGYRHITGAKRWDSLSKARYLKQLYDVFFANQNQDDALRGIAKEIGSRKDYVAQMLTGLEVYENALSNNFYGLQRIKEEDVDFSLLTTALSYSHISSYIGLSSRTDPSLQGFDEVKAKDLFSWMYSQDVQGNTILGESRNLKKLAAVVSKPESVRALKESGNLENAYLYSEGPSVAFSKMMTDAENKLRSVYNMLPDVKDINNGHSEQMFRVASLVEDIEAGIRKSIRRQKDEA